MIEVRILPSGLKHISGEPFVCTGSQVSAVMRMIDDLLGPLIWICADVSAMSWRESALASTGELSERFLLGSTVDALASVGEIRQFLSGVLVGVTHHALPLPLECIKISQTEERPKCLQSPVDVEIHLFDTTFLLLYFREDKRANAVLQLLQTQNVEADATELP